MPLLSGDLASFCLHGAKGEFAPEEISFQNGWSVCCVLASKGYPETSHSGDAIQGLDDISNASVYHAGTKWNADKNCYETNGGRVLAVVAQGDTLSEARQRAHNEIKRFNLTACSAGRTSALPASSDFPRFPPHLPYETGGPSHPPVSFLPCMPDGGQRRAGGQGA